MGDARCLPDMIERVLTPVEAPSRTSGRRALIVAVGAIVVAALAALPWYGNSVFVQFGISVLLLATLAQGWNIIGGYTGYASFGNSVFY
ncbi:MAG TPA: hypothetical protein VGL43_01045, partial [Casimicrobiaceae bacterium]